MLDLEDFFVGKPSGSAPINSMISYIDAPYNIAFDIECSSQVASNFHSMDRFAVDGRELVNLVRSQPRIERILLENLERSYRQSLLFGSQSRRRAAKRFSGAKAIFSLPLIELLQRVV